ncbi:MULTISPECIES: IS5 family transposase [unclassified Mesorhizobium]|uniref:IS5 family transposase n=1 Tax=unclassified Mesorhizobium TaxID=325217 RepID=UPI001FD91C92|nr:IS5 family transposase [Mesorhizobium sp. L48C026A00]
MGRNGRVRCYARNAGRAGRASRHRRHDRLNHRPGASLRSRHKKGTQQTEALGRSRGGFTTKLHARCDVKGRPLGFVLTGGEAHDIKGFAPLLRMIADKIEALLADKGYDADAIREELAKAEIEAVIPAKRNRKDPAPHDAEKYKWRNLIERLFNKLKNWRRVATRYDKTRESYLGFVAIAAVKLWLPFVHEA